MSFQIGFIGAKTHTPEYLMHKYWARKPHNVISHCIQRLLPQKGVVIDPFCGSGVTLREGALLGHECYGFDVNPTACLITENLLVQRISYVLIEQSMTRSMIVVDICIGLVMIMK